MNFFQAFIFGFTLISCYLFKGHRGVKISTITKSQMVYTVVQDTLYNSILDNFSKSKLAGYLKNGIVPLGIVDLNLSEIIGLNKYEHLRLGLGFSTRYSLLENWKITGYSAYGFNDHKFKYQGGIGYKIIPEKNSWLFVKYTNDIIEAASINFITNRDTQIFKPRDINIKDFINYKTFEISFSIPLNSFFLKADISTGDYNPTFPYLYLSNTRFLRKYKLNTATLGLLYDSSIYNIQLKNQFKLKAQMAKAFSTDYLKSDFYFFQFQFQGSYKKKYNRDDFSKITIQSGIVLGEAPIGNLYNTTANYTLKNPWILRINFYQPLSFETMLYNEFISDKFVMFELSHTFASLVKKKYSQPQISLYSRGAFGDIELPYVHRGLYFKSLFRGYYESGIAIDKIFLGFGLSIFYRYGPYSMINFGDNLSLKANFQFIF